MDSARKQKKRQAKNVPPENTEREHSQPMPAVPLLVEHGLYCAEQIIAALALSPNTVDVWVKDGLRVARRGCRRRFFWGRDVMAFLVSEGES